MEPHCGMRGPEGQKVGLSPLGPFTKEGGVLKDHSGHASKIRVLWRTELVGLLAAVV